MSQAFWTVQQYKLSFELVHSGRPYAKGHKQDLELIASRLNEHAAFKAKHGPLGWLTEARAKELAKSDRHYVARQNGAGEWIVWDTVSDHRVEFDHG